MKNFGIYIHWPFCIKKCPYCDFNSYAMQYKEKEWIDALIHEIDLYSQIFKNYNLETIFFGGGTPSLISPININLILSKIKSIWPYTNIETTLETNPSSIEMHDLEQFMANGINRFSIGVQSLNDDNLKFLGRLHSAQEAINIVEHAAQICDNISTDFIYTLPKDNLSIWKKELNKIINLLSKNNIKHCSLYQLTIEEQTGFYQDVKNNKWEPMNNDIQSTLYRYTHKKMSQCHWNHYEISNFAKTANNQSKHNLKYWQYENYLGIGPGAHSRMELNNQKIKFNNLKSPKKWKELIKESIIFPFKCIEDYEILTFQEQVEEKLFMGLRLKDGIELSTDEFTVISKEHFNYLMEKGLIKHKNNKYSLSLNGQLKLNAVLKLLFL